jgi:N6-L-threonylcarbamoyladenine synthase
MRILGIETSCDETAAAVVEDGMIVRSSVVRSQVERHAPFGGIVPEIAFRAHMEFLPDVVDEALRRAEVGLPDVDAIAVTVSPGLIGSLLVGLSYAKALALGAGKRLIGVDHIHAHLYAVKMAVPDLEWPCVSLVVSGGHTALFRSEGPLRHVLLGTTQDDAAGEAFDKAAKILGLPFPGGPSIQKAAQGHEPEDLPRPMIEDGLDFSFSGLKTAVLYRIHGQDARHKRARRPEEVGRIAAGVQEAITDVLVAKAARACAQEGLRVVAVGGGVAANRRLREKMAARRDIVAHFAPMEFCTDNAAMIAGLAYHLAQAGMWADWRLDATATKDYRKWIGAV